MIKRYITQNSIYEIDTVEATWTRIVSTEGSGELRGDSGTVWAIAIAGVGQPMTILGPPVTDSADARTIWTSPLVAIEEEGETA